MNRIDTFRESTEGFSASEKALVYGFLLMVVLVASLLLAPPKPAHADTTFTVNSTGDAQDININDTVCDTSTQTGNQCTLRAAIQEANDTPGADLIKFNIGGTSSVKTISPARPLPDITDPVTIDGYSQPGASPNTLAEGNDAVLKIELNGTNAGAYADGLDIRASNSTIKGLVINRFNKDGIVVQDSSATGNRVEGNFVGTNAAGTADLGNGSDGVHIIDAPHNTIGGTAAAARNIISGNEEDGVEIAGSSASSATGNKVEGNFIGTSASGTQVLGNARKGVLVYFAPNNTIGGMAAGARNRIAFNGEDGVMVFISGGTGNRVLSNSIFSNGGLGIALANDGVTSNDTDDPDTGPNNLQNFPVIASAKRSSATGFTTISGTLNSNPSQEFTVQCFVADDDPSGHGEGERFLTQDTTVTTDRNGDASFSCTTSRLALGDRVSATATNETTGDTSEFSQRVEVRFDL